MKAYVMSFLALSAMCGAAIEWPSDFWEQVGNAPASSVPAPVVSDSTNFVGNARMDGSVQFATESEPFDSRVADEKSVEFFLDSRPIPFVLVIR